MQINIRIGAGAVLLAAAFAWFGWPALQDRLGRDENQRVLTESSTTREPEVIPTNGGILVVARVKGYETFTRTDPEPVKLFDRLPVPLGTTVSEIRTAALFQYQIKLEKKWPIECSPARCLVRTGKVELATPVAIYTRETQRRTASGWGRFDKHQNLQALESELGPRLAERGNTVRNREVGLRDGRETVRQFVSTWLQQETGQSRDVVVLFPGEQERPD